MDLTDFKKDYPSIADALIAEGRALENGGTAPDPTTIRWRVMPEPKPTGQIAPKPAGGAAFTSEYGSATDMTDQRVRREWDSSAELRAEFVNDFAAFSAYRRAEARGAVRVLRGKSN